MLAEPIRRSLPGLPQCCNATVKSKLPSINKLAGGPLTSTFANVRLPDGERMLASYHNNQAARVTTDAPSFRAPRPVRTGPRSRTRQHRACFAKHLPILPNMHSAARNRCPSLARRKPWTAPLTTTGRQGRRQFVGLEVALACWTRPASDKTASQRRKNMTA